MFGKRLFSSIDSVDLFDWYKVLLKLELCGAHCVLLRAPTVKEFSFASYLSTEKPANEVVFHGTSMQELEFGLKKEHGNAKRVNNFIGGRLALRGAMQQFRDVGHIIGTDEHGAPTLPADVSGSISHKDNIVVAAAKLINVNNSSASPISIGRVGIDIERRTNKAATLMMKRLLSADEISSLGKLHFDTCELEYTMDSEGSRCKSESDNASVAVDTVPRDEEVLLRFSFKEAFFKAAHPILQRPIGFDELQVYPRGDGSAELRFCLTGKERFSYAAQWRKIGDYWLTCIYLTRT